MATDLAKAALPEGVYSDGEHLWRAKPGATSTFEEQQSARAFWRDVHSDQFWNPWRFEAATAELEQAMEVMGQWERAEPGFKRLTKRQWEARWAREDKKFEKQRERDEVARAANRERYDEERHEARLALLEHRCALRGQRASLENYRSGKAFPAMDPRRRSEEITKHEQSIARHEAEVARLEPIVGDPEDVPDETGRLPKDRRGWTLYLYTQRRIDEVREHQATLAELDEQYAALPTSDRPGRSAIRTKKTWPEYRLKKLLAVPRQQAEDMCADCALPVAQHGYSSPPYEHPCPAWPGQRALHADLMKMLESFRRRDELAKPPPPKPEPLAIIPSGLPIGEVAEKLKELEAKFPGAEVRRGRANRWELWPGKEEARPADS